MCGIIGYVGSEKTDVASISLDSLHKLEYRGYNPASAAVLTPTGIPELHRRAGKIANLDETASHRASLDYTRWTMHGQPNSIQYHVWNSGIKEVGK